MLYALAEPLAFLILLLSFVVGVTLHGCAQALVAARQGDRTVMAERRTAPDPRRHVDPFGAVGAALAGFGWSRPLEDVRRTKGQVLALAAVGVLAQAGTGALLLVVHRLVYGSTTVLGVPDLLTRGTPVDLADVPQGLLLIGGLSMLYLGALNLVPLPPLDGGRVLLAYAPYTLGWQKARHYLVENNVGLVALIVLLLFPLGPNRVPLVPYLLDLALGPLARMLAGG